MNRFSTAVIIPSHNRSLYLSRAIRSVLDQQEVPFMLFVVDDGSTEDLSEPRKLVESAGHHWISQKHSGVSTARNAGIYAANTEFIAFLDSDDEWKVDKLHRQLEFHSQNPEYVVSQTDETWIRDGRKVNKKKYHILASGDGFVDCVNACAISPSSVIIKRQILLDLGGFDENMSACEDYDLWLRLSVLHKIGYIPIPLIQKYGGHKDQLSTSIQALDRLRVYSLLKLLRDTRLTEQQLHVVYTTVQNKLEVLVVGRKKRLRSNEVSDDEELTTHLEEVLSALSCNNFESILSNESLLSSLLCKLCKDSLWTL